MLDQSTKRCPCCDTHKPIEEFGKVSTSRDGRACYCRACSAAKQRERRALNPDVVREKEREYREKNRERFLDTRRAYRQRNPERIREEKRQYAKRHPDVIRSYWQEHKDDPVYRQHHNERNKTWKAKNPEKVKAGKAVQTALRSGKLVRQPCEVCGASENVHAHHDSYEPDKWLSVQWLCITHHEEVHHYPDDSIRDA